MGKDVTVAAQEITDLGRQLVLAQTRRAETDARLRQAQSVSLDKLENVPEVLSSVLIRTLREQQAGLTAEIAYVSKQKGRNHPEMIGLRSRLRGVQEQIAAEVDRIIDGLRNEVTVAVAAEAELERRLIRAKDNLGRANEAQGRLQALQSEATANQTLFDAFLGRLKQTGGDDLLQVPDSHIASHAEVPLAPSFPRKSVLLPLAVAAAAFLGLVFAFVNELLDESVRSMDQVEGQMYVRPLGLIPAQRRSRRKPEDDILVHRTPPSPRHCVASIPASRCPPARRRSELFSSRRRCRRKVRRRSPSPLRDCWPVQAGECLSSTAMYVAPESIRSSAAQ